MKVSISVALLCCGSLLAFCSAVSAQTERFDNFKVYNVFVKDDLQMKAFQDLKKNYPIRLLQEGSVEKSPFYLAMEPAKQRTFEEDLSNSGLQFDVLNENLQSTLDERSRTFHVGSNTEMTWTQYHKLSTIWAWTAKVARENSFVTRRIIGYSAEGRPIYALRLSKGRNRKAIFIESNIHAVEWISSAVSTCFLNNLLNSFGNLTNKYDFVFVPVLNPDGLYYSQEKSALWRKNRRYAGFRNESGLCYGVDLNRNFNNHWSEAGYNLNDPCDHFFAGRRPETEPEIRSLIRYVKSFPKNYIAMYLALHSYGQLVLLPYGHSNTDFPPNFNEMLDISAAFAQAAEARHGFNYRYGASGQLLGFVSGAAKDYFYDEGIRYTATIELRDRGQYGFFLPADQILDTCDEFSYGFLAMVKAAEEKGVLN